MVLRPREKGCRFSRISSITPKSTPSSSPRSVRHAAAAGPGGSWVILGSALGLVEGPPRASFHSRVSGVWGHGNAVWRVVEEADVEF